MKKVEQDSAAMAVGTLREAIDNACVRMLEPLAERIDERDWSEPEEAFAIAFLAARMSLGLTRAAEAAMRCYGSDEPYEGWMQETNAILTRLYAPTTVYGSPAKALDSLTGDLRELDRLFEILEEQLRQRELDDLANGSIELDELTLHRLLDQP